MNDTPRTEAFYAELYHESTPPEMVDMASWKERDFARDLERELADAREENARIKKDWDSDSAIFVGALRLLIENKINGGSTEILAAAERMRNIEEQRDDAMGQIEEMEIRHAAAMLHTQTIVDDENNAREQRDRLAEALDQTVKRIHDYENYINGSRSNLPSVSAALVYAKQQLAAVKGGQE